MVVVDGCGCGWMWRFLSIVIFFSFFVSGGCHMGGGFCGDCWYCGGRRC